MLPYDQVLIGVAAGLILSTLLRFTPSWRELLAAAVAAGLIDLAIIKARRALDAGAATAAPASEIPLYPHLCPCIALAFIGILAVLHVLRG
jgi:hypothetical protein